MNNALPLTPKKRQRNKIMFAHVATGSGSRAGIAEDSGIRQNITALSLIFVYCINQSHKKSPHKRAFFAYINGS